MALKDLFKLKKNKAEIDEDKNADALEENIGEAVSEEVSKQAEEYTAEKPKPLKERLVKTKKGFFTKLKEVFTGKPIDDEMYEELEDLLAGIGSGDIRINQLLNYLDTRYNKPTAEEEDRRLLEKLEQKANSPMRHKPKDHIDDRHFCTKNAH